MGVREGCVLIYVGKGCLKLAGTKILTGAGDAAVSWAKDVRPSVCSLVGMSKKLHPLKRHHLNRKCAEEQM